MGSKTIKQSTVMRLIAFVLPSPKWGKGARVEVPSSYCVGSFRRIKGEHEIDPPDAASEANLSATT